MKHGEWAAMATAADALTVLGAMTAGAQDKELTFAVITHAQPGDTFWDDIRSRSVRSEWSRLIAPGSASSLRGKGRTPLVA